MKKGTSLNTLRYTRRVLNDAKHIRYVSIYGRDTRPSIRISRIATKANQGVVKITQTIFNQVKNGKRFFYAQTSVRGPLKIEVDVHVFRYLSGRKRLIGPVLTGIYPSRGGVCIRIGVKTMTSSKKQVPRNHRSGTPAYIVYGSWVVVDRSQVVVPLQLTHGALIIVHKGLRYTQSSVIEFYILAFIHTPTDTFYISIFGMFIVFFRQAVFPGHRRWLNLKAPVEVLELLAIIYF